MHSLVVTTSCTQSDMKPCNWVTHFNKIPASVPRHTEIYGLMEEVATYVPSIENDIIIINNVSWKYNSLPSGRIGKFLDHSMHGSSVQLGYVMKNVRSLTLGMRMDLLFNTKPTPCACDSHSRDCLLYTSPSPRDATLSRMPSSA